MKFDIPMNRTDLIVLIILFVIFILGVRILVSFFQKEAPIKDTPTIDASYQGPCRVVLHIDGMMCGMCETHVKEAIRKGIPEAFHITARHTKGTAGFRLKEGINEKDLREKLATSLSNLGYRIAYVDITDSRR